MSGCRFLHQAGPSDDNVRELAALEGVIEMIYYHIQAVLASERRKTLIAEAEAAHWARQARRHRQLTRVSAARIIASPTRSLVVVRSESVAVPAAVSAGIRGGWPPGSRTAACLSAQALVSDHGGEQPLA